MRDEPTNGLDPEGAVEVRDLVRGLPERGATTLLCTHRLAEIEATCDYVVLLQNGELVTQGTLSDAIASASPGGLTIEVAPEELERARQVVTSMGLGETRLEEGAILTTVTPEDPAIVKLRYLPTPRWTAAAVAAVAVIVGAALLVTAPVWMATLEFGSGTLQRTLTGEPDRNRVLASKLALTLAVTAIAGIAVAAAAGGLTNLAANHAGVEIDRGDLAAALFGQIPEWIADAAIGFGFGLLSRSMGGGIAATLAFVLALDGLISFIPGARDYSFGQLSQDLSNGITGVGETQSGLGPAIVGVLAWCAVIIAPGWIRFLRGDLT